MAEHRIEFDRPTEPPPPPPVTRPQGGIIGGPYSWQSQAHTAALNNLADAIRELAAAFTGVRARVQADALRAAAEVYLLDPGDYRAWLRERADQIEREAKP